MALAAVVVVAIIIVFNAAIKNIHPGSLAQTTPAQPAVPTIPQQTPQSPTGSSPSRPSYPGAGQKPSGVILDYGSGYVTISTIAAYEMRGFDATGFILFDKQIQDGVNSANWTLQNAPLDYVDLYSFNGITRVMNPLLGASGGALPTIGSPISGDLIGPGMAPVGQTASTSPASGNAAAVVPYPASTDTYVMAQPAPTPAVNDSNSWFQTGNYLASIGSGA